MGGKKPFVPSPYSSREASKLLKEKQDEEINNIYDSGVAHPKCSIVQ